MAYYKSFWDLQNSKAYTTHTVGAFDLNYNTTGGGTFRWVEALNTSIPNIAGIRIKPLSTTVGYWERITETTPNISWFGTTNIPSTGTFASQGFTQPTLDTRYGAGVVTTTDNFDTAAIKFAFKLMETFGYNAFQFEPKKYYLTSTCYLPKNISGFLVPAEDDYRRTFLLEGNRCFLYYATSSAGDFTMIASDNVINQAEANPVLIRRSFTISNINAYGDNVAGSKFLTIGPSYNSHISKCVAYRVDKGMELRFALNATVEKCEFTNCASDALYVGYGNWSGATTANSQSNHTLILGNRFFTAGSANTACKIEAASGIVAMSNIYEGSGGNYGFYFDGIGSNVKECKFINNHVETTANIAAFYFKCNTGVYTVDGIYCQYPGTLVYNDSAPYGGLPEVLVRGIGFMHPKNKFRGSSISQCWIFERNIFPGSFPDILSIPLLINAQDADKETMWYGANRATDTITCSVASKTFNTAIGQSAIYTVGANITAENAANRDNFMSGTITSYNNLTGQLVCNMTFASTGATFSDWLIFITNTLPSRTSYSGVQTAKRIELLTNAKKT
jgi:hypothetical protein